jgi:hypothetical protein
LSELPRALSTDQLTGVAPIMMDEATFRWQMNGDAMATESPTFSGSIPAGIRRQMLFAIYL